MAGMVAMLSAYAGPAFYGFEEGIPETWKARDGDLSVSRSIVKEGLASLKWEYPAGGVLRLQGPMGMEARPEGAAGNALSTLAYWVYNPEPVKDVLSFRFHKDGKELGAFEMGLDFEGWRAAWVRYEWDIGDGIREDPDSLVIEAPNRAGTLYWDLFATAAVLDSRSPVPDQSVPFIGHSLGKRPGDIWNRLVDFRRLEEAMKTGEDPVGGAQGEGVERRWKKAFMDLYAIEPGKAPDRETWKADVAYWELSREEKGITGKPLFFPSQGKLLSVFGIEPDRYLRDYGRLFFKGATGWTFAGGETRREWASDLLLMFDFLLEQGWADGSGQGVLHHLGYSMRELYRGLYLARPLLEESGRLGAARDLVSWYSGTGRIHETEGIAPSIDTFNTQLEGILISILMHPAGTARQERLQALRTWLGKAIKVHPGIGPIFKEDGSIYHHRGHYPAYANGGLRGLGPVLYALGGTPYALDGEAFAILKKALLAYRFNSNTYHWPRSISGRHPNGTWELNEEAFFWIAQAGEEGIDEELAGAYLRLSRHPGHAEALRRKGFVAEGDPAGTLIMPWAGLTAHRQDGWLALVRGFSRYLWSHETYRGANLFGRYLSHGQLELLHRGDPVTPEASGFRPDGWDWFHLPGATNPVADYAYLRADILNLDDVSGFEEMLLSAEAFNGGVASEAGGMHGLLLKGHEKYGDDLEARKSYTFAGNWIICLGSGITAVEMAYPVHTTLFQVSLDAVGGGISEQPFRMPGFGSGEGRLVLDPTGVAYLVPSGQELVLREEIHRSPDQKTERPGSGHFAKAWIDHGQLPEQAHYRYAIHMAGKPGGTALPFDVIRQDKRAHVVAFPGTGRVAHTFFEADVAGAGAPSPVLAVDRPCLLLTEEESASLLRLEFTDPDLRLYTHDGDQWTGDGRQQEVSIYSRPWQDAPSREAVTQVRLKGRWDLASPSEGIRIEPAGGKTTLLSISSTAARQQTLHLRKSHAP